MYCFAWLLPPSCQNTLFYSFLQHREEYNQIWVCLYKLRSVCLFVCVYVVRDYVDTVKVLPNKPACDNVSCNNWFTFQTQQNILAKCIKIVWKYRLPLCSVQTIVLLAVIDKFKQLQDTILFVPKVHNDIFLGQMFAHKWILGCEHKNLKGLGTQ